MSETIVEVVTVEASTVTVDVIAAPPAVVLVDVIAPPPPVAVIDVADFGSMAIGYPNLPVELGQVPISFPFGGKPQPNQPINVPMGFSLTIPPGLAGAMTYAATPPTAQATFTLNRISLGITTLLGVITLTPESNTSCLVIGTGGAMAVGDVLQILAPAVQDETLADVGLTIVTDRE